MVTRSAAPPLPPLHGLWSRMPPLLWDGVWGGVVVGVLGFGSSLSFCLLGLGFWVKRYMASSRQGLREGLGCRFVGKFMSVFGLEPAFRVGCRV